MEVREGSKVDVCLAPYPFSHMSVGERDHFMRLGMRLLYVTRLGMSLFVCHEAGYETSVCHEAGYEPIVCHVCTQSRRLCLRKLMPASNITLLTPQT